MEAAITVVKEKHIKSSIVPDKVRANPVSAPRPASKARGKKGSAAKGFFFGIFFCLILLIGAGAAFHFNLANVQTKLVTLLKIDKLEFQYLETQKNKLAKTEAELTEQDRQLKISQQAVTKQDAANENVQEQLAVRAEALKKLADSLSDQKVSLKTTVGIYEAMEPAKAAEILAAYEDQENLLAIVKNMSKTSLSSILAEMAPAKASAIMELMTDTTTAG